MLAKKIQLPYSLLIRLVCFPIQPSPAFFAQALSITGPVSTYEIELNEVSSSFKEFSRTVSLSQITR